VDVSYPRRAPGAVRRRALFLLRDGVTSDAIAAEIGFSYLTVDRWRKEWTRAGKLPPAEPGKKMAETRFGATLAKKDWALGLIRDGKSITDVQIETGINLTTLRRWRIEFGLPIGQRNKLTPAEWNAAIERVLAGERVLDVAVSVGVSDATLYAKIRRAKAEAVREPVLECGDGPEPEVGAN
jgi:transposase-like protein